MDSELRQSRGYAPGIIAKTFVALAAVAYIVVVCLDGMSGADLSQQAIGIVLVPFLLMIMPWLAGTISYFVSRRGQRTGDITFCVVLLAEIVYPYVAKGAS